ncbi:MAG: cysteine--tRNA ligase [Betaproteobacteria bacterium]|nr:cysteine--tRNA ligase [Betaproteobacteria bacterium]
MLRIYNTLARDKQEFVPIRPGEARMYVCGMTVYDYCHLGHGRMMVAFDLVRRWLRASGYRVIYVRNITDIDDKIIKRAAENGEPIGALTERFIAAADEDIGALGVEKPDHEPRATGYVPQMLEMIRRLEDKALAYKAGDGDVNFAVRKFPAYGRLSGKSLDELRAGGRVEPAAGKHDPLDFVLWKHAKPGEPAWPSPWGEGRPGWHIECSAMGCALLGETFDIHGGGQDLQFPHHENEIAQSEGANGKPFVKYWIHNGFVRVDEEKMSKSLGNFFTIREILKKFDAEVVRFFLVRSHYRSPLNYSDANMEDAKAGLTRLYTALKSSSAAAGPVDWSEAHAKRFKDAMDDDFNTAEAVAELHALANQAFSGDAKAASQLKALGGVLGLLQRTPEEFLQAGPGAVPSEQEVVEKIEARLAARRQKNFSEADRIRGELEASGVILEDGPNGTTWRRK